MTGEPEPGLSDIKLREYVPRPAVRRPETQVSRASIPAIDAHAHLGRWLTPSWTALDVGALLDLMDRANVAAVVNLDGMWGEELEANLDRYDRAYPGRFATFTRWDPSMIERGEWEALGALVRDAASRGARGLKVWKDLGLHLREPSGTLLMPDDARLDPVWDACAAVAIPVTIHTGDPMAFFQPLDASNERLEELLENPDWWFGDRRRFPSFERLADAFEGLVARRPDVTFIGAHVAGCAEDVELVGRLLDAYPNLYADLAARIAELGRVPRAARRLIASHPDRILLGSDGVPPTAGEYAIGFRFLETADEHFAYSSEPIPPQGRWAISGLGLPSDVLARVYAANARRLIPGL